MDGRAVPRPAVTSDAEDRRPFIPVEARPQVLDDLASTAWQVAEALDALR